jgi:hypothetical protein
MRSLAWIVATTNCKQLIQATLRRDREKPGAETATQVILVYAPVKFTGEVYQN